MSDRITHFERSAKFEAMLAPCREHYDIGHPDLYEWPNNVISSRAVAYESGVIAREGEPIVHRVDPDELARCARLADAAAAIMQGHYVGMKSEADSHFTPWYRVANVGDEPPTSIDETFVRALFGGTICPLDPVVVEPMAEGTRFWGDAVTKNTDPQTLERWRALLAFFHQEPGLHKPTFACIGFNEYAPAKWIEPEARPPGFEMRGSCLPRVAFALTEAGSVVGLFGHVVWT
jgi:hypothetical protein